MFASRLRIFHSDGDVIKTGKWKTSARSQWPVGSLYHRSTILCIVSSNSNFHSFEDAIIDNEGLKIFTYAWHLWPLSSEGSLAYHIYCDTGHPFKMVISKDLWHSHLFCSGAVITCFNDICLSRLGFEHPTFRLRGERSNPLRHRRNKKLCQRETSILTVVLYDLQVYYIL